MIAILKMTLILSYSSRNFNETEDPETPRIPINSKLPKEIEPGKQDILIDKCEITIILYLIVSKLNPVQRSVSLSSSCDRVQYNTGASEKA